MTSFNCDLYGGYRGFYYEINSPVYPGDKLSGNIYFSTVNSVTGISTTQLTHIYLFFDFDDVEQVIDVPFTVNNKNVTFTYTVPSNISTAAIKLIQINNDENVSTAVGPSYQVNRLTLDRSYDVPDTITLKEYIDYRIANT